MDTDIEARLTALEQDDTLTTDQTLGLTQATGPTMAAPSPRSGPVTLTLADLPRVEVVEASSTTGGDLEVLGRIGAGGMGVIDLAQQRGLRREVAIKRLHAHDAHDDDGHALQALLREAMLVGRLEHPNIVPVHLLGVDADDRPVLVMKRIDGVPWRKLIYHPDHPRWHSVRGDRLAFHLDVLIQLCRAVEFAHSRGVLHRDIKPDNVMIGEFGEVYLLDWGVGCRLETDEVVTTAIVGTPAYMAPEMIQTGARLDARTDVFLLGATLHEALTGQPRHDGAGMRAVLLAAMAAAPHDYDTAVPTELAELCNRCCAAAPAARFASAGALREALEDFLRHRASIALAERAADQQATVTAMLSGDDTDDLALYEVVGECRFAFEQALREWPDNEAARQGLHRLLTSVVTFELARENLGAARTMLARIDPLPEALATEVAALERRLAERAQEQTRLQALADDMDFTVSRAARNRVFVTALAVVVVAAPTLIIGRMTGVLTLDATTILMPALVINVAMVVVGIRWRHVFLRNRINRQISGLVFVAGLSVCTNRLAGALTAQPIEDILRIDYLLLATVAGIATLVVHRLAIGPAIIALTCYLVSALVPSIALPAFLLAVFGSVAFVVIGRRMLRRRQG